jgi:hypothetical protein
MRLSREKLYGSSFENRVRTFSNRKFTFLGSGEVFEYWMDGTYHYTILSFDGCDINYHFEDKIKNESEEIIFAYNKFRNLLLLK